MHLVHLKDDWTWIEEFSRGDQIEQTLPLTSSSPLVQGISVIVGRGQGAVEHLWDEECASPLYCPVGYKRLFADQV